MTHRADAAGGAATAVTPILGWRGDTTVGWPIVSTAIKVEVQPPLQIRSRTLPPLAITLLLAIGMLCGSSVGVASAPLEMVFARLGSNEGLSQGGVMAIVQDAQGFLWFGTEDGLDRFDGYELRHFSYKGATAGTLPNNWIAALARDATGRPSRPNGGR